MTNFSSYTVIENISITEGPFKFHKYTFSLHVAIYNVRIACKFKKEKGRLLYDVKYCCIKNSLCINIRTFASHSNRECRAEFNHADNPANFRYEPGDKVPRTISRLRN